MTDRLTSEAAESHRATLVRTGGGLGVAVPADVKLAAGDEVRLTIAGSDRFTRVGERSDGPILRSAFDTRGDLRTLTGEATAADPADLTNRLREWLRGLDREAGDSVLLDAVDPGHHYGLRAPGERAVYALHGRPDDTLADIADSLDG